jgi:hypothetical protein
MQRQVLFEPLAYRRESRGTCSTLLSGAHRRTMQFLVFPTCGGVASCVPWSDVALVTALNLH